MSKFVVSEPRHHGLKGRFIVIEGPDGAGKSTQVRRLKDRLGERAPQVELCVTAEPWMSYWGKEIREKAARGEGFVIAKAGKPMVKVVPLDAPEPAQRSRLGILKGVVQVPDDFDRMGHEAIEALFGGHA